MVLAVRVLLVVEAVCATAALVGLSLLLLVDVLFGALSVALIVFALWLALGGAIVATLFGQWRIGRGEVRWWWAMAVLQVVVVCIGIAVIVLSGFSERWFGVPSPPAVNEAAALVIPALALVTLALLVFTGRPAKVLS